MNRLGDMAHFPAVVNAGATLNILITITATWWLVPLATAAPCAAGASVASRSGLSYTGPAFVFAPILWVAIVLFLDLLPVVILRLTMKPDDTFRPLGKMDFFRDQHKFSDWVYLAASANMAFWILVSWTVFSITNTPSTLAVLLLVAFAVTFSPVLVRAVRR